MSKKNGELANSTPGKSFLDLCMHTGKNKIGHFKAIQYTQYMMFEFLENMDYYTTLLNRQGKVIWRIYITLKSKELENGEIPRLFTK